jgi:RNA 2',3'-cyclic 3'-phosphodiesterase
VSASRVFAKLVQATMTGARQPPLRTFFALWPSPEVRTVLAKRASLVAKACSGRPSRPDTLHLTLVFIGSTPRERVASLTNLMDGIHVPQFALQLDQCGWWRHNGIAWAGTHAAPEALITLQQALARGAEKLGFSLDVRPYVPHLTLARDAGRSPPAATMHALDWDVGSFVLVASELTPEGPRYRVLHECALDENLALAAGSN